MDIVDLELQHAVNLVELRLCGVPGPRQARGKQQSAEVPEISIDRSGDSWILNLHSHEFPGLQSSSMHLSKRSRCKRVPLEAAEHIFRIAAEFITQQLA